MSKGDSITVTTLVGEAVRVEASRAGRRVRQEEHSRNKTRWLDVFEVTRGGRPTGNTVSVRYEQVVAVTVTVRDEAETQARTRAAAPKRPKRSDPVPGQVEMFDLLDEPPESGE